MRRAKGLADEVDGGGSPGEGFGVRDTRVPCMPVTRVDLGVGHGYTRITGGALVHPGPSYTR